MRKLIKRAIKYGPIIYPIVKKLRNKQRTR
ncbi:hypothetical protein QO000_001077 [Alkalihalobacillus hemicentroti]|uniref:Stage V sporulation protein SpoVM n=1 Tax=Guptibacillus hwajinpoensis TaxID=208199 RepID=A0ABU0K102_9BACL|nr:hypothetical protein [Alkalihalobacillus hemicentroti]